MIRHYAVLCSLLAILSCAEWQDPSASQDPLSEVAATETVAERGQRLELDTALAGPPGDPASHYAMGFARVLCSAIFVSGLEADFAAKNVGFFTSPPEKRRDIHDTSIDQEAMTVTVTTDGGIVRVARYIGDLGCVPLPMGESSPYFEPPIIETTLADAATTPWPMGDSLSQAPPVAGVDSAKLDTALDVFFTEGALSAAIVVTVQGEIVAERYGPGITPQTPLESWSMGKSLTATLLGVLIQQGEYVLTQPAPIPQWQSAGDPRQAIQIQDILRMSSGLRCPSPYDPEVDNSADYFDHHYVYTGTVDSFAYAANRPQQWPPNTVGRYRNCDPVLANYLIRLAVEGRGDDYHQFPQTALFDKIGIRNLIFQTDPFGNILLQGSDLGTARDWARLGNLYLNEGVAHGERVLPEGFSDFVRSVAPAWQADGRPVHGGFFWLEGATYDRAPSALYSMLGAGGQMAVIVPSKDLVVVRLGHSAGETTWQSVKEDGMRLLLEAVPDK
ncbi:beta-lactamase family protein [Luminiphilus sp.]|nr:beta-lactamase family protein [Luminiphilus sp.]